ncbi:MAG: peptidase S41, partial [Candidatus Aminicenantes bacterium]|nr:peptidase S41 [Candidatus Aminicenantes bacterium]
MKKTSAGHKIFIIKVLSLLALVSVFSLQSVAQAAESGPLWMRYPAISPDGSTIVFSYQGNLFRVSRSGGQAFPLTIHSAYDYLPVWSHDGKHIAFASNRYGNFDVFIIPAEGGAPRRLTFHSADDLPFSFTPKDEQVVFGSSRMDQASNLMFPTRSLPELYSVPVRGGRPHQVLTTPALNVSFNDSGRFMLFEDAKGFENAFRKHHTSSITRDIWVYGISDHSFRKLTQFDGEDRDPKFAGTNYYYLSERTGSMNVFKSSLDAPDLSAQISDFELHPVRNLSVSQKGVLCYSWNGEIYTQEEGRKPTKVDVEILTDNPANPIVYQNVTGQAGEMVLSPNGKELAFVFRGEVFVTAVDGGLTKRITNTPEQERHIDISPDGKSIVYSSERGNSWNLYLTSLVREGEKYFVTYTSLEEKPVLVNEVEAFQPAFSPDGKEVAYIEDRVKLNVINLKSGEIRTIMDGSRNFSYTDGDQHFEWSPDGKWFLVHFLPDEYWTNEVGMIRSDGKGDIQNLTRSGFFDANPHWVREGTGLIWASNKSGMH